MLSEKNHTEIAKIIEESRQQLYVDGYVNFSLHIDKLCQYFKIDNPKFDEEKFRDNFY